MSNDPFLIELLREAVDRIWRGEGAQERDGETQPPLPEPPRLRLVWSRDD